MTSSIIAGVVVSCNQGTVVFLYVGPTMHASVANALSESKNYYFVDKELSQQNTWACDMMLGRYGT